MDRNQREAAFRQRLIDQGHSPAAVDRLLAETYDGVSASFDPATIDRAVVRLLPRAFCEENCVVPIALNGSILVLAYRSGPPIMPVVEAIKALRGGEVAVARANEQAIRAAIEFAFCERR